MNFKTTREDDVLLFLLAQELKRGDSDYKEFSKNGINKLINKWGLNNEN